MGKVIAVTNQKGGVGKTTTAVNLGAGLSQLGKKVLVVDMDPQGNSTSGLGVDKKKVSKSLYDVIVDEYPLEDIVLPTELENLFLAPATISLAAAELELVPAMSRENKLKWALDPVREEYDFLVIDCPPSLGLLTLNALTGADSILVPIQCEFYALEGLTQLMNTVHRVQSHLNPDLKIEGVLLTMFDSRTNLSTQVVQEVRKFFREKVYQTVIPRNIRLSEAPSHGQPIIVYDPKSKGAEVYMALAEEVARSA